MRLRALAGQPAEDAALGHLKAGCDGGYSGQRGWQAGHVRLHVAQQLLQLVQNWGPGHGERRARERQGKREMEPGKAIRSQMDRYSKKNKEEDTDVKEPETSDRSNRREQQKSRQKKNDSGKCQEKERDQIITEDRWRETRKRRNGRKER